MMLPNKTHTLHYTYTYEMDEFKMRGTNEAFEEISTKQQQQQ